MPALINIPMPPSSNNMYATVKSRGRMIRVKSAGMRSWEVEFRAWALVHHKDLSIARSWVSGRVFSGDAIRLDRYFWFWPSSIVCKDGSPKKLDVTNRIKALDDALADVLHVDDKWFFSGYVTKRAISVPTSRCEFVDVELKDHGPVT